MKRKVRIELRRWRRGGEGGERYKEMNEYNKMCERKKRGE